MPRTLVVLAHPDDEVIALGARLPRYRDAIFLYATDGAPRDARDARASGYASCAQYRSARRSELESALTLAGIPQQNVRYAGVSDQRAAFELQILAERTLAVLREFQPQVIVTHPYEGGHPDHDACAFVVQAAVSLLRASSGPTPPLVIEAAFYHQDADGNMQTGHFRSGTATGCEHGMETVTSFLSWEERVRKEELLSCFPTQRATLHAFPCDRECFRVAPAYDFSRPPHPGALFYEQFDWGITGVKFCEQAQQAAAQLELAAATMEPPLSRVASAS